MDYVVKLAIFNELINLMLIQIKILIIFELINLKYEFVHMTKKLYFPIILIIKLKS